MPPPPILDPATLDLDRRVGDVAAIEAANPHRYEFRLLDAIVLLDMERNVFAGFHEVRAEAFWARGHIPGRPLFPGVLMIEAAAQLASYVHAHCFERTGFLGFTGVEATKFRGVVQPPGRLVLIGRGKQMKPRRMSCEVQGFVENAPVFETTVNGMVF